ncbi:hypothetical protein IWX90DRAFT_192216 [Phyllosticta citrichinensis]|uniref:Rhodopsin domain-containing protein n=1 Tax=Phyllosticta citrichinensis TaxID=1130410 RepID=A0ABR1XWV1_9PEZI
MARWLTPPDYPIPVTHQPATIRGTSIFLLVVAWIAVLLRLWCRFKVVRSPGWDDLIVSLALVSSTIGTVTVNNEVPYGFGLHLRSMLGENPDGTINYSAFSKYLFWFMWTNATYCSSTGLIKLSIAVQYTRLFGRRSYPVLHWTFVCIAIAVACWGTAYFFMVVFSCSPVEKSWNFLVDGHCILFGSSDADETYKGYVSHTASNMCLDVLILTIPLPTLARLKMCKKQKLGLIGLFSLGTVAVLCAALRLWLIVKSHAGSYPTYDPPWYAPPIVLTSDIEVNLAILTASMPIFWPFLASTFSGSISVVQEIIIRSETRKSCDSQTHLSDLGPQRHQHRTSCSASDASDLRLKDSNNSTVVNESSVAEQHRKHYGDKHVANLVVGELAGPMDREPGHHHHHHHHHRPDSPPSLDKPLKTHQASAWFEPVAIEELHPQQHHT